VDFTPPNESYEEIIKNFFEMTTWFSIKW
jgi:hypothetical protein